MTMDKVIGAFKEVIKNSTPVAGKILKSSESLMIVSKWSQMNVERKISASSELMQSLDMETRQVMTFPAVETSSELMTRYSPSANFRALFRDIPAAGKQSKKQHLEVWSKNQMFRNCDLTAFDLHGDVNTDGEFGCFEWSACEKKILYTAEKKKKKSEPFLPTPHKKNEDVEYGTEYLYSEEWGETLVGKSSPILAYYDIENDKVSLIEGAPVEFSLGQGIWAPDGGVVCVAWDPHPRRLGLVYCPNRKSWICHISPDGKFTKLTHDGLSVRSPKFSPNGESLVWLERDEGGPHLGCFRLVKFDWTHKKKKTVVDIVDEFTETKNGEKFYGLYCLDLGNCWLGDNKSLILSTPQLTSVRTFVIDTDLHTILDITGCQDESYSLGVFDVKNDVILAWKSSISQTPSLIVGKFIPDKAITWDVLVPSTLVTNNFITDVLNIEASYEPEIKNFSALYFGPKNGKDVPLIVCAHGGPHSASSNTYSWLANFFAALGFAAVYVNYRGSIGAGENTVKYLLGKVGSADVQDVHQAAQIVLSKYAKNISPSKVVLFGGSHGGFLVLHLAGQFPSFYKSVAARNPVVNIGPLFNLSDIPDWAMTEGGYTYDSLGELDGEKFESLRRKSPIFHIDKIVAPILLLMGRKDLRVHPSQGISFYHSLKARGKKTKMICYEDNHGLRQIPHEVDLCINSVLWYLQHFEE